MKVVTVAEANRQLSAALRDVVQGKSGVVTSRGKPMATIGPSRRGADRAQERSKQRLLDRLRAIEPSGADHDWARDDLHD